MIGVSDLFKGAFIITTLFTYSSLHFSNQTSDKMANNTNNSTWENIPLETRTRSQQTSAARHARTTELVPNPELLLRQPALSQCTRSTTLTISIAETTIYHILRLGSLLNHEPNPFVENRANRSRLFLPGLFNTSRNKPLAIIVKELALEEDLLEGVSILLPKILGNTSNSQ